ncbi:arginyltransferase [Vibrio sp.]|nr:arginyltransferase [Vibrio sp.]
MNDTQQIKIGLTSINTCSYLPDKDERVAVIMEDSLQSPDGYDLLMANGFRRSGNMIYRPSCPSCNACQAIRVAINDFSLSKSQKRIKNKAAQLTWQFKSVLDEEWFTLYSHYIETQHQNGSMYPPNKDEFLKFIQCDWLTTRFLHVYDEQKLIAIAVTDICKTSESAFYTFYDPTYPLSLGKACILYQIEFCKNQGKPWLYLGYQIDDCPAMNYKVQFQRHQRLANQCWQG